MPDKVPAKTIERRWREIMAIQQRINREQNKQLIGKRLTVLVEGVSPETEHLLVGRHEGQAPEIDGKVFLALGDGVRAPRTGELVRARVDSFADYDLGATALEILRAARPRKSRLSLSVVG